MADEHDDADMLPTTPAVGNSESRAPQSAFNALHMSSFVEPGAAKPRTDVAKSAAFSRQNVAKNAKIHSQTERFGVEPSTREKA